MKRAIQYQFIIFILLVVFLIYYYIGRNNVSYVVSQNNNGYFVQNLPNKTMATNILDQINMNIKTLINYLKNNIGKYPEQKKYIETLYSRTRALKLSENGLNDSYTTYTVNKGDEIVFCLRSKTNKEFHDINLLMFVTIHELAHVACPELDHTPLFVTIFIFLLQVSISIGIYTYQDYSKTPVEYCGMELNKTPLLFSGN